MIRGGRRRVDKAGDVSERAICPPYILCAVALRALSPEHGSGKGKAAAWLRALHIQPRGWDDSRQMCGRASPGRTLHGRLREAGELVGQDGNQPAKHYVAQDHLARDYDLANPLTAFKTPPYVLFLIKTDNAGRYSCGTHTLLSQYEVTLCCESIGFPSS